MCGYGKQFRPGSESSGNSSRLHPARIVARVSQPVHDSLQVLYKLLLDIDRLLGGIGLDNVEILLLNLLELDHGESFGKLQFGFAAAEANDPSEQIRFSLFLDDLVDHHLHLLIHLKEEVAVVLDFGCCADRVLGLFFFK